MRKLFLLLAISFSAFAASAQNTAKVTSASLKESKASGVYVFNVSDKVTKKDVDASAAYYTQYFNTSFDEAKHEMKITLTENADINKRVIQRLLASLRVSELLVDGKPQTYEAAYEKFLK